MIGLSVSFCFRDMALGKVSVDEVEKIIGSTAAKDAAGWEEVIAAYRRTYWTWSKCADEAERLLREFLAEGKIEQPRLTQGWYPVEIRGERKWVESEDQIKKSSDRD